MALGQVPAGLKRDEQKRVCRSKELATEQASHECGSLESGQNF